MKANMITGKLGDEKQTVVVALSHPNFHRVVPTRRWPPLATGFSAGLPETHLRHLSPLTLVIAPWILDQSCCVVLLPIPQHFQSTKIARKSLTLVRVGPVIIKLPVLEKKL